MQPYLESDAFQFIGTTETENYSRILEKKAAFARLFRKVELAPATVKDTLDILEYRAIEAERKAGYLRVSTPHLAKKELYLKSGHIPYFQDSMYPEMHLDDGNYYLKAMNCPHHHLIYNHKARSYRDMPLRISEYGTCYRNELSGVLSGWRASWCWSAMRPGHRARRKRWSRTRRFW